MLSLHTNAASLAAQAALSKTNQSLATSMTRLSTGYRINSAMDDAAGLQIATRLNYQGSGMKVAMSNTQKSISMIQTADGALDEANNILVRMKDLATQAADASATTDDQKAMQSEYDALTSELSNIMTNTKFGGEALFTGDASGGTGKFTTGALTFQIGDDSKQTMQADISTVLKTLHGDLKTATANYDGSAYTGAAPATAGSEVSTAGAATTAIGALQTAIDDLSQVRSQLGATGNRLDHVYNNLANTVTNLSAAEGNIMDVDYATETANMTANQMLTQASTAMLKQSNSQSSLVMSLLQA